MLPEEWGRPQLCQLFHVRARFSTWFVRHQSLQARTPALLSEDTISVLQWGSCPLLFQSDNTIQDEIGHLPLLTPDHPGPRSSFRLRLLAATRTSRKSSDAPPSLELFLSSHDVRGQRAGPDAISGISRRRVPRLPRKDASADMATK